MGGGGGGLQRHDSSQSRGGEDRLSVGLTRIVCFERNLMLQSSRKKNQMAVATTGRTNGAPWFGRSSCILLSFKEERRYENRNTITIFSNYFPTRKCTGSGSSLRGVGVGGGAFLSKFKGS